LSDDKTESASARRLEKAREQGDIPISRELNLVAGLIGGLAALSLETGDAGQAPLRWFAHALRAEDWDVPATAAAVLRGALPCAVGAALAASAATLLQSGFLFRPGALMPDLSRVSPMRGLKRIASVDTLMQALKSLAKLALLTAALWSVIRGVLPVLTLMPARPVSALAPFMQSELRRLILPLVGAQVLIAVGDVGFVRWQHARKLRMSRQEQRDEHKDSEGNPQAKQRMRQLARLRGRRRMMAAVATSTVVVTNPTHYAVALLYERGSRAAPRVVGKGADEVAARIRELAEEKKIPVVANPPLARALYTLDLDTEIPAEHFKAVAEIVAYIWRLNRAARPRSGTR
jgi:flagellar biosynthetic protein FlhB